MARKCSGEHTSGMHVAVSSVKPTTRMEFLFAVSKGTQNITLEILASLAVFVDTQFLRKTLGFMVCWEIFYIFAYCDLVGNPHLTAKI